MNQTTITVGTKVTITEQNIATMDSGVGPVVSLSEHIKKQVRDALWMMGHVTEVREDHTIVVQFPRVQLPMCRTWVTALTKV